MILLQAAHPPAGATTLIVSLGIVTKPSFLLLIEVAVGLLTLQAIAINRLAGLDYPLWARRVASSDADSGAAAAGAAPRSLVSGRESSFALSARGVELRPRSAGTARVLGTRRPMDHLRWVLVIAGSSLIAGGCRAIR